jgi:phenylalanyl-tRNA synthetase beta chain
MKLSLNQVKQYQKEIGLEADLLDMPLDQLTAKIGAQLGAIDEVVDLGKKYQSIVIVEVISCEKHPDADKLSLCMINDGQVVENVERNEDGLIQVVCGAPNVKQGLKAVWLPPGSFVPESYDSQPFKLEVRQLRGETSNGMLASAKELALGDSHDGILEVDPNDVAGSDFAEVYGLKDEVILDIENKMFTHRPDCFGLIGLMRELAGIEFKPFKSPDWYKASLSPAAPENSTLDVSLTNELPGLVSRICLATMSGVKVGPSPLWLQVSLARLGVRSINNIVDLTNYYMLLSGQPLHAYDYDKLKLLSNEGAAITVRQAKPDERLVLLNGKTIKPAETDIMIATDKELIGLGGIMGGQDSEVDNETKNIVIECANFNMYSIRRSSMHHGIFSEAVTRFNKGQSPLQNSAILAAIIDDVTKLSGAKLESYIDNNQLDSQVTDRNSLFPAINLQLSFVNQRLGSSLSTDEVKTLLENVEFNVEVQNEDLSITAPFWRTDIELREDIVEEVGRLYGYDKLPLNLPKRNISPVPLDKLIEAKTQIRSKLSRLGANEILSYSFIDGSLIEKVTQDKAKSYEIANALRPELQYYRQSLMPSLLEKVYPNLKSGFNNFGLFEIGKIHNIDSPPQEDAIWEGEATAFMITAADKLKLASSPYYQAKYYLEALCPVGLSYKALVGETSYPVEAAPFEPTRSALVSIESSGQRLGIVGEFKANVSRSLKLPKYSAGFEVDSVILGEAITSTQDYKPLPRFPKVSQDISLVIPLQTEYQALYMGLSAAVQEFKPAHTVFDIQPLDIYQSDTELDHKSITFRLNIASFEQTLTDHQVNQLLDEVSNKLTTDLQAERV